MSSPRTVVASWLSSSDSMDAPDVDEVLPPSLSSGVSLPAASASVLLQRRVEFHAARRPDVAPSAKYRPINMPVANKSSKNATSTPTSLLTSSTSSKSTVTGALCPDGLVEPLLRWRDSGRRVGAGLVNLGNTCFLNSTLQCLTHTAPLAQYLLGGYHARECTAQGFCLMCELQSHVARALGGTGPHSSPLSPSKIVGKLRLIARHLRFGHQEDAHEFMTYFFEGLQRGAVAAACAARREDPARVSAARQETTVVHRVFGGALRSRVTCSVCGSDSDKIDPFLDLSLEIVRQDSLSRALAHFTAKERLRGDNRYRCEPCGKLVDAEKRLSILSAPNVLVVQLKRFDTMMGSKISRHIAFDTKLDLRPYMSVPVAAPEMYSLYAVLIHRGSSTHSGHYYCFVRAPNGVWYAMNDADVRVVSLDVVLSQQAYMLFYSRDTPEPKDKVAPSKGDKAATKNVDTVANGDKVNKSSINASKKRPLDEDNDEDEDELARRSRPRHGLEPTTSTPRSHFTAEEEGASSAAAPPHPQLPQIQAHRVRCARSEWIVTPRDSGSLHRGEIFMGIILSAPNAQETAKEEEQQPMETTPPPRAPGTPPSILRRAGSAGSGLRVRFAADVKKHDAGDSEDNDETSSSDESDNETVSPKANPSPSSQQSGWRRIPFVGRKMAQTMAAPEAWDDDELLPESVKAARRRGIHAIHASLRVEPRADDRALEVDRPKPIKTLAGRTNDGKVAQPHLTPKQRAQGKAPFRPNTGDKNAFQRALEARLAK